MLIATATRCTERENGPVINTVQQAVSLRMSLGQMVRNILAFHSRLINDKHEVPWFLAGPHAPFTNNKEERNLQMMNLCQKISGGARSLQGTGGLAILRRVIMTAGKQGRNVIETLTTALEQLIIDLNKPYNSCSDSYIICLFH